MHLFNELLPWTNAWFCALVSSSVTEERVISRNFSSSTMLLKLCLEWLATQEVLCKLRWYFLWGSINCIFFLSLFESWPHVLQVSLKLTV